MKRLSKITLVVALSIFTLSGIIGWTLAGISFVPLYRKHGFVKQWPPPSPFSPIDGVVIEKVIFDTSNHGLFHGDGSTIKIYEVTTNKKVGATLSNRHIRDGHIWVSKPFDGKATSALYFLSRWTLETEAAPYISQLISSGDLHVSYVDLKPSTDASLWLFSPKLGLLAFIQVNT